MPSGTIPIDELAGGIDLYRTLESGQTYLWRREDGEMYQSSPDKPHWYDTVVDGDVIRVRERTGRLEWRSTTDAEPTIRRLLRLEDDLDRIVAAAPADPLIREAYASHAGMRLVRDPPFGTLVSFICSAQMRVSRIHRMVTTLAETYGDRIPFDGRTHAAFPRPEQLAKATEDELRDLGLGYRAPYVVRTAEMIADGEADPSLAAEMDYEEARDYLTQFVGVGNKVADCVLLFSLGFDEAVPIDTWIKTAIEECYPACDRGSYAETSRALRKRFGGKHAGYAQTYVFHHLRTGG